MIQSMSEIDFWAIPILFFWTEEDFKKSRYHLSSSRSIKKIPVLQKMNYNFNVWTIFTLQEWDRMIFTVCESDQTILLYAPFQDLREMTEKEW